MRNYIKSGKTGFIWFDDNDPEQSANALTMALTLERPAVYRRPPGTMWQDIREIGETETNFFAVPLPFLTKDGRGQAERFWFCARLPMSVVTAYGKAMGMAQGKPVQIRFPIALQGPWSELVPIYATEADLDHECSRLAAEVDMEIIRERAPLAS